MGAGVFAFQDIVQHRGRFGGRGGGSVRHGDALDRSGFAFGEGDARRPRRTGAHPGIEQLDFLVRQGLAFVGHDAVVDGAKVDAHEQLAFRGVAGDNRISGIAAFEDGIAGVHAQAALGFVGIVAADAIALEDRLDEFREVRPRGGSWEDDRKKSEGGEDGGFGEHVDGW